MICEKIRTKFSDSCDLSIIFVVISFLVSVVADVPVPGYQAYLQFEYQVLIGQCSDADTQYRQLFKVLCATEDVTG